MQFTALRFGALVKAIREWRSDHVHEPQPPENTEPVRAMGFQGPVYQEEYVVTSHPQVGSLRATLANRGVPNARSAT